MHSTRTHFCLFDTAITPSVPTMFCVCPDGKEYPVASALAYSTMLKFGSSTHGRGMRNQSFKN